MNILYIAYSCNPYAGSEDKTGWAIPFESSQKNNVTVITKTEQKPYIERFEKENSFHGIEFHYVDIPHIYKKLFRGFFYSGRMIIWHRSAEDLVENLAKKNNYDIIHQITPLEFRSIGRYYGIRGSKYICGPLGGAEYVPSGLKDYERGHLFVESIRRITNRRCFLYYKRKKILDKIEYILFANNETKSYLLPIYNGRWSISTDVGIAKKDIVEKPKIEDKKEKRIFICAGRLIYRKGHNLLFDSLERIPEGYEYECRIIGTGPEKRKIEKRVKNNKKLTKHVVLLGAIPFEQMKTEYEKADVLIMPSIRETTGNVLLEAQSRGIPVITINRFGGATFLEDNNAWLYDGKVKEEYIESLSKCIIEAIIAPDMLKIKKQNALQNAYNLTWETKYNEYENIYKMTLEDDRQKDSI